MTDEHQDSGWPEEAGDVNDLAREMTPSAELEDRVTGELVRRGLIGTGSSGRGAWRSRSPERRLVAAAASVLLMAIGFAAGRWLPVEGPRGQVSEEAAAFEAPTKYALLLYETEGYRPAAGAELLTRYREYSAWVAEARGRGQFVTGEDFAVDDGRVISPVVSGGGLPAVAPGVRPEASAPLSGVFLITARDYTQAVELAERLPHLAHGGQVVVQRVVPTEEPPAIDGG